MRTTAPRLLATLPARWLIASSFLAGWLLSAVPAAAAGQPIAASGSFVVQSFVQSNVRSADGVTFFDFTEHDTLSGTFSGTSVIEGSCVRYIRLSVGGLPFQIIGTDGGFIEAPVTAGEVLLPPGDRVELAVGPFEKEGEIYGIDDLPFYHGTGRKRVERFGTIRVGPRKACTAHIPRRLREITPLVTGTPTVTRTVELGFKVNLRRGFDFVIDGERHHHAEPVNVGELQVWDVVNTTQIDHPFHLHGFFFQVLEIDGKAPAWRSLEDVVNVPPKKTVRIAWYPDDRPGMWMYHCHILEHHAAGMMAHFEVKRP
jgi:FtsP/CotA-like multicopper oxidase with cupredoxin domain